MLAVSTVLRCQRDNGLRQRVFISTDNGGVTLRSARLIDNPAGMTLRETILPPNVFSASPPPWAARADRQSFFAVKSVHAFVVQAPALPLQQDVEPPVAIAYPRLGQLLQSHPQRQLRIAARLVSVGSPSEAGCPACPPLGDRIDLLEVPNDVAATDGLHHFRRRASCSIVLFKVRSATRRLSLPFSSSRSLRRRISATPIPA